jgi:hypothetical protein
VGAPGSLAGTGISARDHSTSTENKPVTFVAIWRESVDFR